MNAAKAMVAMISPVVCLVASLNVFQVMAIASGNASQLRIRWNNHLEISLSCSSPVGQVTSGLWPDYIARASYFSVVKSL